MFCTARAFADRFNTARWLGCSGEGRNYRTVAGRPTCKSGARSSHRSARLTHCWAHTPIATSMCHHQDFAASATLARRPMRPWRVPETRAIEAGCQRLMLDASDVTVHRRIACREPGEGTDLQKNWIAVQVREQRLGLSTPALCVPSRKPDLGLDPLASHPKFIY